MLAEISIILRKGVKDVKKNESTKKKGTDLKQKARREETGLCERKELVCRPK